MNFEGFSVLTKTTLVTNILAFVAFLFLGVVNDKVLFIVSTYFCLVSNLLMLFILSDVKFYKTKKYNNQTSSKKGVMSNEEI